MKRQMLRIGRSSFRISYSSNDVRAVALSVGVSSGTVEPLLTGMQIYEKNDPPFGFNRNHLKTYSGSMGSGSTQGEAGGLEASTEENAEYLKVRVFRERRRIAVKNNKENG